MTTNKPQAQPTQPDMKTVDTSDPNALTNVRGSVYGPPIEQFNAAQKFKFLFREHLKTNLEKGPLTNVQLKGPEYDLIVEALDMIAVKVSRIVTGDPTYLDNWDDIAGYAACVTKYFRGPGKLSGIKE